MVNSIRYFIVLFFLVLVPFIIPQDKDQIKNKKTELTRIKEEISTLESQLKAKTIKEKQSYVALENYSKQGFLLNRLLNKLREEEQLKQNEIDSTLNRVEYIEKEVNQLIILTHEREFFKWLFIKLDNPKALSLIPDGDTNGVKKSTVVDCNVNKEFIEDENLKDLKDIENIYSSNKPITNYEGLCAKCRRVLESVFIRKYLFELEDEINTRKSVRTFVDKLKIISQNDFEKVPKHKKFIDLCDNLNIELHNNTFRNEGQNAQTVLGDFLNLIKEI